MQSHVATLTSSQFTVIQGDPFACSTSAIDEPDEAAAGVFRPGIFYFRRRLESAAISADAIRVGLIVADELAHTQKWMSKNGLPNVVHPAATTIPPALKRCSGLVAAKAMGFLLCGELERVRAWLSENGYPIPKQSVLPEEAEARGWRR